jgi:hypothetical protein
MGFAGEELVGPIVRGILLSALWAHAFLCYGGLLNLTVEHLKPASKESEVRRAMDRTFREPGVLAYMPAFQCAQFPLHNGVPQRQVTRQWTNKQSVRTFAHSWHLEPSRQTHTQDWQASGSGPP